LELVSIEWNCVLPIETNSGEYWADYYLSELDAAYRSILGIEEPQPAVGNKHQLKLDIKAA
jgi:hypothetical protein